MAEKYLIVRVGESLVRLDGTETVGNTISSKERPVIRQIGTSIFLDGKEVFEDPYLLNWIIAGDFLVVSCARSTTIIYWPTFGRI